MWWERLAAAGIDPGAPRIDVSRRVVAIYADGGTIGGNPSPVGGTYAWCHVDAADRRVAWDSGRLKVRPPVTNNQAELYAVLAALATLPDGWSGHVCSDSQVTLGRVCGEGEKRSTNIPRGWIERLAYHRGRLGELVPVQLDGHPTKAELEAGIGHRGNPVSVHNVWCDEACRREACDPEVNYGAGELVALRPEGGAPAGPTEHPDEALAQAPSGGPGGAGTPGGGLGRDDRGRRTDRGGPAELGPLFEALGGG